MATPLSGGLRIITSLSIVIGVTLCGYWGRSPWIILLLTPVMTVLYVAGKWASWKLAYRLGGLRPIVMGVLVSLPVQAMVTGVFYLLGAGIASVFGGGPRMEGLTSFDWNFAGIFCVAALVPCFIINFLEGREDPDNSKLEAFMKGANPPDEDGYTFTIAPVTMDTFFNYDFDLKGPGPDNTQKSGPASDADILATEKRLGVALPERLKQLYRMHDGGDLGAMAVPAVPNPKPGFEDYRHVFAHDYDWLLPLKKLNFYYDEAVENWADPDDPRQMAELPENAKSMLILAKRCADTTYLDYSAPGEPKVCVEDFDFYSNEKTVEFKNFDTFFKALCHFDVE